MAFVRAILASLKDCKRLSYKPPRWSAQCPAHEDDRSSLTVAIPKPGDRITVVCSRGCTERFILAALDLKPKDLVLSEEPAERPARKPAPGAVKKKQPSNVVDLGERRGKMKAYLDMASEMEYKAGNFVTEKALLGSVFQNPTLLAKVRAAHIRDDLQLESSRLVLDAMLALDDQGLDVNQITVQAHLHESGRLERAGGAAQIFALDMGVPFTDNITSYLKMIRVLAEKHRAAALLSAADVRLHEGEDPREVLSDVVEGRTRGKAAGDQILADIWVEEAAPTLFRTGLERGSFYRYDNGIWRPRAKYLIRGEIQSMLRRAKLDTKPRTTYSLVSSIYGLAAGDLSVPDNTFDANQEYLVCGNGVLHLRTREHAPHRPELHATAGVSYDYKPNARGPGWRKIIGRLAKSLGAPVVAFLQEYVGLCYTADTKFEIAVWLQGKRGSGKSTFIHGVEVGLGDRHCVLGLEDIEKSRFMLSKLLGRTLATSYEQPDNTRAGFALICAMISGETIPIDRKFLDPIDVVSKAKLLWAMTKLPIIRDPESGIWRRLKIVKFPPLPVEDQDLDLKEKIESEGPYILNWALEGLDRLYARGKFDIPASVEAAVKEFEADNDIYSQFLAECCERGATFETQSQVLYDTLASWGSRNNLRVMSSTRMKDEWIRLGLERTYHDHNRAYWRGVELSDHGHKMYVSWCRKTGASVAEGVEREMSFTGREEYTV